MSAPVVATPPVVPARCVRVGRWEQVVRCPYCDGVVGGLLAGCSEVRCVSADIADDHRQARREDV